MKTDQEKGDIFMIAVIAIMLGIAFVGLVL